MRSIGSRIRIAALVAAVAVVFVAVAPAARAQLAKATLGGTVTDPDGDAVAGARVVVTEVATAMRYAAVSNDDGAFTLMSLAPGTYVVDVEADTFATWRSEPIELHVGQNAKLDVDLLAAERTEDAVVARDVPASTASPVVDGVISSHEIRSLPLNGRNFLELGLLLPGTGFAPTFELQRPGTVLVAAAGQSGKVSSVTIDGADDNDVYTGGPIQNVSEEAVEEFQIATSRLPAELGRTASAVANVVTKSGTNRLHGTGTFFYRDHRFQALPATFDRSVNLIPPFDREQIAGAVGGPIVKDRAWWFASAEYRNQDGGVLVGWRDLENRTIARAFAPAPLDDVMTTERVDWLASDADYLTFRHSLQHQDFLGSATLFRPLGAPDTRISVESQSNLTLASWRRELSPAAVNVLTVAGTRFSDDDDATAPGLEYLFPSLQSGVALGAPQSLRQSRFQLSDTLSGVLGAHTVKLGGDLQRTVASAVADVFRSGAVYLLEDFADADRNGDGVVDDDDLLVAATARAFPYDRPVETGDVANVHGAVFVQDDWQVHPRLRLSLGVRYEIDSDIGNVGRIGDVDPALSPYVAGPRRRDTNDVGPRLGFTWSSEDGRTSVVGGYAIAYDRVVQALRATEQAADRGGLRFEVRSGNAGLIDPATGRFLPGAPTYSNPLTGSLLSDGAGDVILLDSHLQNPEVQQSGIGVERVVGDGLTLRADYVHDLGTHFVVGRTAGTVPASGALASRRVQLVESSAKAKYDGLLVSATKRFENGSLLRASYTLSKAFTYTNTEQSIYDQIAADGGNDGSLSYGPAANDQRHRLSVWGVAALPARFQASFIWTAASGVPLDVLLPTDAQLATGLARIPGLQRNAGGRLFRTAADLNAFIAGVNRAGGVGGLPLPTVADDARFDDGFTSFDLRLSRPFALGERARIEPTVEVFNLFNVTNVLGTSTSDFSGFSNVLARGSQDPTNPGYLRSSSFGRPVTTAGGVFGSGGPRAFQFSVRFTF